VNTPRLILVPSVIPWFGQTCFNVSPGSFQIGIGILLKMKTGAKNIERGLTILELLRPHKKVLWLGLLAISGETMADLLEPWPLKIVLDNVISHKASHGWLYNFIRRTAGTQPHQILLFACVAVAGIALLDAACSYSEKYITTSVGQWITHDLRRMLYAHVQRLSLAYHDQKQTGDLISRVTTDIDAVQTFIVSGLLSVLVDILTLAGMIGVMFYVNWQFTLVALAVVPILFVIVFTYTKRVKKASREVRKHEGRLLSVVQEVLGSIRVVKAFARENYEIERFEGESLETVEAALKARALKARLLPIVNMVTAAGVCAVLYFGGMSALHNGLTAGSIVLFLSYISKMYKPMQDISKIMDSYSKADVGYERIQEIIRTDDEMGDAPNARVAPRLTGAVDFEHVDFSYGPESAVLSDVNLHIEAGTSIALVGPTGSGKTTIANLIARFYDPSAGAVKIDGIDVAEVAPRSDQFCFAGNAPLQRIALGQHCVRQAGSILPRDRKSGRGGQRDGVHRETSGAVQRPGRRARRNSLRWPAAAYRHCTGYHSPESDSDPRRAEFWPGCGIGATRFRGPRQIDARPNIDRHCPPAFDHPQGNVHLCSQRWTHCRERRPRRVDSTGRWRLPRPSRYPVQS
jgi:subfamily B ATP-binding cassette protein MsbA